MTTIFLDVEADSLLPFTSKIWVVCTKVLDEPEVFEHFDVGGLMSWIDSVKPTRIIGHNLLGFDLSVLRRVFKIPHTVGRISTFAQHEVQYIDTLYLSQCLNPDREGGHGLANLGSIVGCPKMDYRKHLIELGVMKASDPDGFEFSFFHPSMVDYCKTDVSVSESVYKYLLKEVEKQLS